MKTIDNHYADFEKVVNAPGEARSFRQICRSIGVCPLVLSLKIKSELGISGPALVKSLRERK